MAWKTNQSSLVVGGGTSGLAIAARLAETASVAVVEAGGIYQIDNGNQSVVPAYAFTQGFTSVDETYPPNPLMDWDLLTVPMDGAAGRKIHYAQGKTLGGSSAINNMAYHRATVGYHERWAELVGDDSYEFDNVLPFFKKSTHHTRPKNAKRAMPNATVKYDATVFDNGPVEISYSNFVDTPLTWIARGLQGLNMPLSPDGQCTGHLAGYGAWNAATMTPKAKRSSAQAYLVQAIQNTNLMVYPHTQVTKILFDSSARATGVTVKTAGIEYTVSANNEVIVSAGSFHTPQLLMVSGTYLPLSVYTPPWLGFANANR